jgi:hypothetical protein
MQDVRLRGNEAREGRNKIPPLDSIQYEPLKQDKEKIMKIKKLFTMPKLILCLKNYLRPVRLKSLTL